MDDLPNVSNGLLKVLNSHGYNFQEAVKAFCSQLERQTENPWQFMIAEYPVDLHGRHTRVDFILVRWNHWIVAECKRADPATARWCFARMPYTSSIDTPGTSRPVVSVLQWSDPPNRLEEMPHTVEPGNPYHIARELRTHAKGEGVDSNGLEKALTQAFRGVGGLIQAFNATGRSHMVLNQPTTVFPVVFTTAELWVTDTSLSDADVASGDLEALSVAPVGWLWYQENLSRDMRPHGVFLAREKSERGLEKTTRLYHTRAACVVNVRSIPAFLRELKTVRLVAL